MCLLFFVAHCVCSIVRAQSDMSCPLNTESCEQSVFEDDSEGCDMYSELSQRKSNSEFVTPLTAETLKECLASPYFWVVYYYLPHCHWCKEFNPTFDSFASNFKDNKTILFGEVDCQRNPDVCKAQGIFSVPDVKLYYQNNKTTFSEDRTTEKLSKWVEDTVSKSKFVENASLEQGNISISSLQKSEKNDVNLSLDLSMESLIKELDPQLLEDVKPSPEPWIITFYRPSCEFCQAWLPHFNVLAEEMQKMKIKFGRFNCADNMKICKNENIFGAPSVRIYHNNNITKYRGEKTANDVRPWINEYLKSHNA
ncbi:Protein disulfide-isomerase [Monocercomonoides exilis]|uniref:Protein disulfide-isomerase n=1 Tax=Monocercomonoides exilis TaxID=2049356 RepID=UPI003559501D|nr:Protein disulfide-isomerase [Monocercomonoides exilis]|eukprot:MONOS_8764.1-p1 / transcript=MONOS_8764.1 / gene=MONOS_8764 / organism=Monocercomonoides_exilis_PA203 / gene_product=Protein disulfide-isomerase / transcript_product=Protein disulfide-isomerase / location=Mono_scaffold00339:38202-39537(+) / protein_length=310 / sequence_SO=supercontig / SO=protein_coding / is_pseudo=false